MYQLSRLANPAAHARILALDKAIIIMLIAGALLVTFIGSLRFFVGQKKVESGRMRAGGFDLWGIGGGFTIVELMLFISIILS